MKIKILPFLFVLGIGLFMANGVFADNEQEASKGTTKTYKATAVNGDLSGTLVYHWSTNGGTTTNLTSITASSAAIAWTEAGTWTVSVYFVDGKGCRSEVYTKEVKVADNTYALASSETTTCSLLTASTSGNSTSGYANTTTFKLTIPSALPGIKYTVVYKVNGGANKTESDYVSGTDISIAHASYADDFKNDTNSDKTFNVTIESVTSSDGATLTSATTSFPITVLEKPTLTF